MCIALIALEQHSRYPLIILANRDEFLRRPTEALHPWPGKPKIYAGKDKEKGGTWLGVNQHGECALLTNYRELNQQTSEKLSRGCLPLIFLRREAKSFPELLERTEDSYPGFNLVWGNCRELYYRSNRGRDTRKIEPGIHGLSNAFLNTPWPKVERGKKGLRESIDSDQISPIQLFSLLADERSAPAHELPSTGLSPAMEQAHSPIKIPPTKGYGSVSATILRVSENGKVEIWEKSYRDGTIKSFSFVMSSDRSHEL